MPISDTAWWAAIIFVIFSILSITAIIIKNKASKSDSVGRSEKDTIKSTVSIKPRKNTGKID